MVSVRCLVLLLASLGVVAANKGSVVRLTDENFDKETASGVWMIKVYAPWCSHCRQMEPLWEVFANEAKEDSVRVGKIDGTVEKALMARLRVTAFPTIFLLRDGNTYVYSGARNVASFRSYAVSGYKSDKALPFWKAPNSLVGRALGKLHGIPALGMRLYRLLRHQKGMSDTAIVLSFLAVPVVLGGALICLLDAAYVRRARDEVEPEHEHQE